MQNAQDLDNLDITDAARTMEALIDDISNWYVRRSRERYWKADMDNDKIGAYLTLYEALVTFIKMAAPLYLLLQKKYTKILSDRYSQMFQ